MIGLVLKLLEFIHEIADANAKQRERIFEVHIQPLYVEMEKSHNEFIRALSAIAAAAEVVQNDLLLADVVAMERRTGRTRRAGVYSQAAVLTEALRPLALRASADDTLGDLPASVSIELLRRHLRKTHKFVLSCVGYFQLDGVYKHELGHLERRLGEAVEVLTIQHKLMVDQDKSMIRKHRVEEVSAATHADEVSYLCRGFIEFRDERWITIAQSFAECRIELIKVV